MKAKIQDTKKNKLGKATQTVNLHFQTRKATNTCITPSCDKPRKGGGDPFCPSCRAQMYASPGDEVPPDVKRRKIATS